MRLGETVAAWLTRVDDAAPWSLLSRSAELDALEMLAWSFGSPDLERQVTRARLWIVLQRLLESGIPRPRRLRVAVHAAAPLEEPAVDERIVAQLLADAPAPTDALEARQDAVVAELLLTLAQRRAGREPADGAAFTTLAQLSHREAYTRAVIATLTGDSPGAIIALEQAAELASPGSAAEVAYRRVRAAELWRAGAAADAAATIESTRPGTPPALLWMLVDDLVEVAEGGAGSAAAASATPSAERMFGRVMSELSGGADRASITVGGRQLRTLTRVKTNAFEALLRAQDWAGVEDEVGQIRTLTSPYDGGAWAQERLALSRLRSDRPDAALDALDDALRARPAGTTLRQPLRREAMLALVARGRDASARLVQPPPEGAAATEHAELVVEVAGLLATEDRFDDVEALIVGALTGALGRSWDATAIVDLVAVSAIRSEGAGPWWRLCQRLLAVPGMVLTAPLHLAQVIAALDRGAAGETTADLEAAVAAIRSTPAGRMLGARQLTLQAARSTADPEIVRRLATLAVDIGPIEPGTRDEAESLVAFGGALQLLGRTPEAFAAVMRASGLNGPQEVRDEAVQQAAQWSDLSLEADEARLDELDDALRANGALVARGHLRTTRLQRTLGGGDIAATLDRLADALAVATEVSPSDARRIADSALAVHAVEPAAMERWARLVISVPMPSLDDPSDWRWRVCRARALTVLDQTEEAAAEWEAVRRSADHRPDSTVAGVEVVRRVVPVLSSLGSHDRSAALQELERFAAWAAAGRIDDGDDLRGILSVGRVILGGAREVSGGASIGGLLSSLTLDLLPLLDQPRPVGRDIDDPPDRRRAVQTALYLLDLSDMADRDQPSAREMAVLARAAALKATGRSDEPDADRWRDVEPHTPVAARLVAALAATAGDHARSAAALRAEIILTDDERSRRPVTRRLARELLRGGDPAGCVALLTDEARRIARLGRQQDAIVALMDLLHISHEPDVDGDTVRLAVRSALETWTSLAAEGDIPSPALSLASGDDAWASADYALRAMALQALQHERTVDELVAQVAVFADLYPDRPEMAWAVTNQAIALARSGNPIVAIEMLERAVELSGGPARDHQEEMRRVFPQMIGAHDDGAREAMLRPVSQRFSIPTRFAVLVTAVRRLAEADHLADAVTLVVREASGPLAGEAAAIGSVSKFLLEERADEAWHTIVDGVADAPETPAALRAALLWARVWRRRNEGRLGEALIDLQSWTGSIGDAPAQRRDRRRLLAGVAGWPELPAEDRERLTGMRVAIGPPPDDSPPDRHAEEWELWVATLAAAERPTVDARQRLVEAAVACGDDAMTDRAVGALEKELKGQGRLGAARWSVLLGELVDLVSSASLPSATELVRFYRAWDRHGRGMHDGAADDIDAIARVCGAEGLSATRVIDAAGILVTAGSWPRVAPDRAARWRAAVLAMPLENARTPQSLAGLRGSRARALLQSADAPAAWDELRVARPAADQAGTVHTRNKLIGDLRYAVEAAPAATTSAALTEFWEWYAAGPREKGFGYPIWFCGCLRERGASDAIVAIWRGLVDEVIGAAPDAVEAATLADLRWNIVGQAELTLPTPVAARLLELAAEVPGPMDPYVRGVMQSSWAFVHGVAGDLDAATALFAEAHEIAADLADVAMQLRLDTPTAMRVTALMGNLDSMPRLLSSIRRAQDPDVPMPADVRALALRLLGEPGVDEAPRARFPRVAGLSTPQLFGVVVEQYERWSPDDVMAADAIAWMGEVRRTDGVAPRVRAAAHFYWSQMSLARLSSVLRDASGDGLWDVLASLRGRDDLTADEIAGHPIFDGIRRVVGDEEVRDAARRIRAGADDDAVGEALLDATTVAILEAQRSALTLTQAEYEGTEFAVFRAEILHSVSYDVDLLIAPGLRTQHGRWLLREAVAEALRLDARAAASRSVDRRQQYLALSEGAWFAAVQSADLLGDSHLIAEILAVHRSSLVLDRDRDVALPQGLTAGPAGATGSPDAEDDTTAVEATEYLMAAAAPGVLAQLRSTAHVVVRPRPLIALPDGSIALAAELQSLEPRDRWRWLTPAVVPLS